MKLAQIIFKHEVGKSDAEKHWGLVLENLVDCKEYLDYKEKVNARDLWDYMGDREMKGKGNNTIGKLMDCHINAQPEGTSIHLGGLAMACDLFHNKVMRGMEKILDMGDDIRVTAAGGYCHLSSFHVVRTVNIDKTFMVMYMNEKSDDVLTNNVLKFYEYMTGRTLYNIIGQDVTILDITSMAVENWNKKLLFKVQLQAEHLPQDGEFKAALSKAAEDINQKYFMTGFKVIMDYSSVRIKQAV
jgi:hypothetical protein